MARIYDYRLFGLSVRSEIALPELIPSECAATDVDVRLGEVPPLKGPVEVLGMAMAFSAGEVTFEVEKCARFAVREGCEIVVSPLAGADEAGMRVFLLGSAFGALCHQRGLLPLHANAVEIDGRAFAFSGLSGAGKSTLAAHFQAAGRRLLCDDVCALSFDAAGRPLAWPGVPRLKLWEDAVRESGRVPETLSSIGWGMPKYHVPMESYAEGGPFPLAAVYWLDYADEKKPAGIFPLSGLDAVNAVMANTYRRRIVELMGEGGRYLGEVQNLVRNCPLFAAVRRPGFDVFAAEAAKLERHMRMLK